MSESNRRKKRQVRFLEEHPDCYFCGGVNRATEIDHVPPRACFPKGYAPEGFESPACKACNEGTSKSDQIFGFYSMLTDFDESTIEREETRERILELRRGIANNYPEALPDLEKAYPVNAVGSIVTPRPMALALPATRSFKDSTRVIGAKLTHALYFRETGKILTSTHQFFSAAHQPQRAGTENLSSLFLSLLPNLVVGTRTNVPREYGDRFRYIFGYKDQEDFFQYAAQFGHGIILWGISCGRETKKPCEGMLNEANWTKAGCGDGAPTPSKRC